jgi:hypothetical protein
VVERSLDAADTLSTDITGYAVKSEESFPKITLPDFEIRSAHLRMASGTHIVHYMRDTWEEHAPLRRSRTDDAFERDSWLRAKQDEH